ncbi:hypothetical protein TVAG_346970 [Trichomonas vaginalis G3]|uniref:Uncharacterized protein n=1 Tax=Trichomonas vaginalis (strain ATCC PRA-98 / G3) TaxID=412133 RepID=A2FZM7_TRIV3|nr:hypothetical protein TVAGG3_0704890 [Trichomonas vaginalis G3]EAX89641.1 hypothetical protein TVAG_346970 [Trichomonas vaginalis G3]KAI5509498.1 hypothetical protein TVAGG3_0704890 [Trichomonas vaginalis G3]|eukprot:XP_001302571.1 hypothetical protein [Trichomonas vaginalis G3]
MLPFLALRSAYNADDDNWRFPFPIPTKWGLLSFGVDANEEDDDNWGIGFTYHSPWGKFYIGYHNSAEEEEDENWKAWAELMTAIGKFRLEYHNAAEEDDDDNMNFRWKWGPVDFDLELNEDKKVAAKKPFRRYPINKAMLQRWLKKYCRKYPCPKLYKKKLAFPKKLLAKKPIAPTKNWKDPPFVAKLPWTTYKYSK